MVAILGLPLLGQTVTLYDSTGDSPSGSDSIAEFGPLGFSFTTNSSATSLSDVKLGLSPTGVLAAVVRRRSAAVTLSGPGINVEVCANNPSGPQPANPCTQIGAVSDSSVTGVTLVDVPVSPTVPLSPDTRYWIGLTVPSSSSLSFDFSETIGGTGVSTEFNFFNGRTFPNNTTFGAYIGSVTSTTNSAPPPATPAPASLLLTFAGLAGVGFWLAWRAKSA